MSRIDIPYIHDPDDHWEAAIGEAYPALHRLREQGVVRAIGVGMNQSAMLARFAREGDFDVFLVASRYTLLDQEALTELLPLCQERGIAVLVGGVMNSGVLADPRPGSHYDYGPAPAEVVERARRLAAACDRHGVPLRAAAIQFPLAHPAVTGLIAGVRTVEHLDEYPALMRHCRSRRPCGTSCAPTASSRPTRRPRHDGARRAASSTRTTTSGTRPGRTTRG